MKKRSFSPAHCLMACCCVAVLLLFTLPVCAAGHSEESTLIGGEDSGLINLLLIGQDRRENETAARADCIILCSLSPAEKKIVITSFLRDLYVEIPDHESNRLNAAYAFGGMELLRQTMEQNFGLQIDGCIEADFSQFPKIIDVLGGVSIELRQDEADSINRAVPGSLSSGTCLLSGEQALAYSRIRNLDNDGDFSRTMRQRKLVSSLLSSYRNADLLTILSVVVDTLPMVTTTLSNKDILLLAAKLFPLLDSPEITSHRIPADGTYAYETIRSMDVLTADMEDIRSRLRELLLSINKAAS